MNEDLKYWVNENKKDIEIIKTRITLLDSRLNNIDQFLKNVAKDFELIKCQMSNLPKMLDNINQELRWLRLIQ